MDRIEGIRVEVDDRGLILMLQGDFQTTCEDYLARCQTQDGGANTIAFHVAMADLRQLVRRLDTLRHG